MLIMCAYMYIIVHINFIHTFTHALAHKHIQSDTDTQIISPVLTMSIQCKLNTVSYTYIPELY